MAEREKVKCKTRKICVTQELFMFFISAFYSEDISITLYPLLLREESPKGMTGRDSSLGPALWAGRRANNSARHRCIMQILHLSKVVLAYYSYCILWSALRIRIRDPVPF